jgi:hypothetical protein
MKATQRRPSRFRQGMRERMIMRVGRGMLGHLIRTLQVVLIEELNAFNAKREVQG